MNFSFMLTIILIILVFIRLNIKEIPNYMFLVFLLIMLSIGEIYNYKEINERFSPYKYHGTYEKDKYIQDGDLLHIPENHIDRKGLECSLVKNVRIKEVQNKRFDMYREIKQDLNNVVYSDKQIDEVKMPSDFGNISNDLNKINKINETMCPPVCNLIENQIDCEEAVDIREVLPNDNELTSTRPIFNNAYMMDQSYKCLDLNKSDCEKSDNCKVVNKNSKDICVYDKKKCVYHDNKCKNKCEYFLKKNKCPGDYCKWDSNKCQAK